MNKLYAFLKKESVLVISLFLALLSMLWVPPSEEYLSYVDWQVLAQLFCLMAVISGLQSCGLFDLLAQKLLSGRKRLRLATVVLVLLPFFCSMLVTNDVALITFIPFTVMVLEMLGCGGSLIPVIVLQTVAANLGSMVTPVGNPQNLYLYSKFSLSAGDFFAALLPYAGLSLVLLFFCSVSLKSKHVEVRFPSAAEIRDRSRFFLYLALFVLCLLSVFRVLPYLPVLGAVLLCLLLFSRKLFLQVDYGLLLTFLCFFIFVGNIGCIAPVRSFLSAMADQNALLSSAAASQVISNVPAAILFSGFTDNWRGLLIGTNLGGLGTLIASLASLISFRFYARQHGAETGRYLLVFTLVNLGFLAVLSAFGWLLGDLG